MNFQTWLESRQLHFDFMKVDKVSPQQAREMFGPVYHGSTEEGRESIADHGFKTFIGDAQKGDVKNGYKLQNFAKGRPAPIHHIGYGVYFSPSKGAAKIFNNDSVRGLTPYYIDKSRMMTFNFQSTDKMMDWWINHGYDMPVVYPSTYTPEEIVQMRIKATVNMTNQLKSEYSAIHFTSKGYGKRMDVAQVCVYDQNAIFQLDKSLAKPWETGSQVEFIKNTNRSDRDPPIGTIGEIGGIRQIPQDIADEYWNGETTVCDVNFGYGTRTFPKSSLKPIRKKRAKGR